MSGNIQANSLTSPSFLEAKSPKDLQSLMLTTNIKDRKQYHFRDIQFASGSWYCWYDKDQSETIQVVKRSLRQS